MWMLNFNVIKYFIISYIYTSMFVGSRCHDYDEECISCKEWNKHDEYHKFHKSIRGYINE